MSKGTETPKDDPDSVFFTCRMPTDLRKRLEAAAQRCNRSSSNFLVTLLSKIDLEDIQV